MEDEFNRSAENYILKNRIIVNNLSTVPTLHYNNAENECAANSLKFSKGLNESKNVEYEKNEDNSVELPFKYEHFSNKNIQIQSSSTNTTQESHPPEKAFSPTIFENAVKVVKNIFSPVKAHGMFYRTTPPTTYNDVDSRKKIDEEENVFSEVISDKFDQSKNFFMKIIETNLDSNRCTYEVDANQSIIKNCLNSIDAHNNTSDSYTTTVSRMDDSFQSTVTHFDDCIQVGGEEINEQIVLFENVILDNSLNETLDAKYDSLNNTLIKNISPASLESEHLNDTFETSIKCNTFCKDIQDDKYNFLQKNVFHVSLARSNYGFGENELNVTLIDNVPYNFSDKSKKESKALEETQIFTTSFGKTKEKLMLIDENKNQEKLISMDISSNTLKPSRKFNKLDKSILDIFTENSNLIKKKFTFNEHVETISKLSKGPETVCEVNLFFTAGNSSKMDCLTFSEKDEFDAFLEESEENKYPRNLEKNFNASIFVISVNETCDINNTKSVVEENYSRKLIAPLKTLQIYEMNLPNFTNQKIRGESISDVMLDNQEGEKMYDTQNVLSQMSFKKNINEKYFTGNSIETAKKLKIVNNTERKNIMEKINDNQLISNPADKSNSLNLKSNLLAKEQYLYFISNLNFKITNYIVNQWKFQNDLQLDFLSTKYKPEHNENRIPVASQRNYTVLYNSNSNLNRPVLFHRASDTEIDKFNDIVLGKEKFMDLNVTYCKTDAQDKMQNILENNINVIDTYDNSISKVKEIQLQQTIRDNRFEIEQFDNKEVLLDFNNKKEIRNALNKDSNLNHFMEYIESFTETKTGLEIDGPMSSPSKILKAEKTLQILKLSENRENIDPQNISDHVKIIKMALNNELEKVSSREKSKCITGKLSMDQNCLEVTVKNSPEGNILLPTRTLEDKRIREKNISFEGTNSFLQPLSNANSLKSLNLDENRFHLNHFELEKAQTIISDSFEKCDTDDFFTIRDVNFHIIKELLSNKQCLESNFKCSLQGNETFFPTKNSFLKHEESILDIKKMTDNLIFDIEGSALDCKFKEENKNENLNGIAVSENDIVKKFNDTLTSVLEINSNKIFENLDRSQISGNNIDFSTLIRKQFAHIDIEKIYKVADDVSNLYLCENISNSPLNFLNSESFPSVKTTAESNKTIDDETHNFILDDENALSSSSLDFLGSIKGKPSKRDYSRESLFIKFDPLMQTEDSFNLLRASEKENRIVKSLPTSSANENLLPISPPKHNLNSPNDGVNPLTQKNLSNISNVKMNKLRKMQNEIFQLKKLYLHKEEMNKEKINIHEEKVMKLRTTEFLLEKKIKESESREKLLVRKLTDQNESAIQLKNIVEEYFAYAMKLAEQFESIKVIDRIQIAALRKDRDCYTTHLQNTEQAFSDVHSKYERCKKALEMFKKNGDILKINIDGLKNDIELCNQKIIDIEENTAKDINNIQDKINSMKFQHAQEISRFKAQIRKNELKTQTLQEALSQKIKENKELAGICDELIESRK